MEEQDIELYKVYARYNKSTLKVDEVYSSCFKNKGVDDIFIKEGFGDEFVHVGYYQLLDEKGCHNYKIENNQMKECTDVDKQQELKEMNQIDLSTVKEKKIQESKELLASWLADNPLVSNVHGGVATSYTVTEEKQQQLTQMITLTQLANQTGQTFTPTWNATGGVCEEWNIEELITLSFQMGQYVLPRVKKQQLYELQINEYTSQEEVEAIEIEYDTI